MRILSIESLLFFKYFLHCEWNSSWFLAKQSRQDWGNCCLSVQENTLTITVFDKRIEIYFGRLGKIFQFDHEILFPRIQQSSLRNSFWCNFFRIQFSAFRTKNSDFWLSIFDRLVKLAFYIVGKIEKKFYCKQWLYQDLLHFERKFLALWAKVLEQGSHTCNWKFQKSVDQGCFKIAMSIFVHF